MGHRDVWDYGYSFFKSACKSVKKQQKMQIVGFTTAIGLCFSGQEAIENFLKEEND